jgi:hypothetical protein
VWKHERRIPLCPRLLGDASFLELLLEIDRETAAKVRAGRCPLCGGPLHVGHFCRKPRGFLGPVPAEFDLRFDFCCGWCRKRCLPPSIRFLGRRVYLGVVVTLATALHHGVTSWRARVLRRHLGMARVTLERWREWWQAQLPSSEFWNRVRGKLPPRLRVDRLPGSLLAVFTGILGQRLVALLRLLGPVTSGSCPAELFEGPVISRRGR